eukprot:TRINITY_DN9122_c0_g1_i10.p1 TRINITY_DN9122_c0_g1~~TRINITY_DN9122_c0_g1_i10.p1  ORF type:complete len:296 (-),score=43.28 TRINITY_DN9122_c0_g1_i10:66-953(-)
MLNVVGRTLLRSNCVPKVSSRTTVIVTRVHKPPLVLNKDGEAKDVPQKKINESVSWDIEDGKYVVYQRDPEILPEQSVKVILLRNMDDYGVKGQIITVKSVIANRDLLLPGHAVYHNDENLEKYSDIVIPEETKMFSSDVARKIYSNWSKRCLDVCMSMDVKEWTLERWHVKASLRKHNLWLTDGQIEIPGGQIKGPNLDLENKEFISVITLNNFDKIKIRCRLHHITSDPLKEPFYKRAWYIQIAEPIFESERQELLDMNRQPPSKKLRTTKGLEDTVHQFENWRLDRLQRVRN